MLVHHELLIWQVPMAISMESNIYSFGIVALELASGRKLINHEAPEDQVDFKTRFQFKK